jgi:hypothetical protein
LSFLFSFKGLIGDFFFFNAKSFRSEVVRSLFKKHHSSGPEPERPGPESFTICFIRAGQKLVREPDVLFQNKEDFILGALADFKSFVLGIVIHPFTLYVSNL